jgi:hypothetical protein
MHNFFNSLKFVKPKKYPMKLKLILAFSLAYLTTGLFAQSDYKQSIGLRLGNGYYDAISAAYKVFIKNNSAIEINLGIRPYSPTSYYNWVNLSASGVYQLHFDIKPVEGLKWFVGGGVVVSNSFSDYEDYSGVNVGLFPTGGVDYKFNDIPLAVSFDVRPTFQIVQAYEYESYNDFYPNIGVSCRYTFKSPEKVYVKL